MSATQGDPTPQDTPADHLDCDAAVVFVHGIGVQAPGGMLQQGLQALKLVDPTGVGDATTEVAGRRAVVWRSNQPQRHQLRILAVDGHWDDLVDFHSTRDAWSIWGWTIAAAPWIMLGASGLAATGALVRGAVEPRWWRGDLPIRFKTVLAMWLSLVVRTFIVGPMLLLAMLIGTLVLCAESVLGRAKPGTSVVVAITLRFIGDARAFVDPERREQLIVELTRVAEEAAQRAPTVVLVGHSQGGALSRLVTDRVPTCRYLVTVGSGANLLSLTAGAGKRHFIYGWATLVGYPALVIAMVSAILVEAGMTMRLAWKMTSWEPITFGEALRLAGISLLSLLPFIALLAVALWLRRGAGEPTALTPTVDLWVDISSIYDPVCSGGASLEAAAIGVSVVNRRRARDLLREHDSYFSNPDVGATIDYVIYGDTDPRPSPDPHRLLMRAWLLGVPAMLLVTLAAVPLIRVFWTWFSG